MDGEILRQRLGRIALQHLLPQPRSQGIGPGQQDAHPHPGLQAAAEVGAVVLQVGREGLQDGYFLLVFRLGLLLVVDQLLQGCGKGVAGKSGVDTAETETGQTWPTLLILLSQITLQLRQLVALAADIELAVNRAQALGEGFLLDRTVTVLIGLQELLLALAGLFPQAENHLQLMGGERVLLALTKGLQECCPAHRCRRIGGGWRGWRRRHSMPLTAAGW